MKKTKVFTSITAVILAAVLLFVTIVTINNNTKVANADTAEASVRTVELAQDSLDEQNILEEFDCYEVYEQEDDNTILKFVGTCTYSADEFIDCDYVSLNDEDVNVTYDLTCDTITSEVSIEIIYEQNEEILNVDYVNITKIEYQENEECAIIYFEDGTVINSNDYLSSDPLDNCVVLAAAAAGTVTVLVQVVVFVLVAVIVYYVLSWLFPWIKKAVTTYKYERKTTYKTQTYSSPAISIDGVRYETKIKTKAEIEEMLESNQSKYYLAFAAGISDEKETLDTTVEQGELYVGGEISINVAYSVMTNTEIVPTVKRDGVTYSYVPSIITYSELDIIEVMSYVGCTEIETGYSEWHEIKEGSHVIGLPHYHPISDYNVSVKKSKGTKEYRHHAFFIDFDRNRWRGYQYLDDIEKGVVTYGKIIK